MADQDAGDAMMQDEWDAQGEGEDMDRDFQASGAVELDFGDDVPVDDSDGEDVDLDGPGTEQGTLKPSEIYGEESGGVDDSLACVSHGDSVLAVAFSPADRRILLTGGQDDTALLWSIEEGGSGGLQCTQRHRLVGHTDSVSQVAFSHDGKYAATGSYDGTVRIWDPQAGNLVHTLDGPSKEVEWILWHPKGHAILAGSADTMAWMWWAPTGKLMQIFAGHGQTVTCGSWGLGGKLIVTGSQDCGVIVWNPRQGTPQQHIRELHQNAVISMCAHPEAPIVVTGSEDSTAKVIHIETGKIVANLSGHGHSVEAVGFNNPDPNSGISLLATASMDGQILIWDGKTFDLRVAIKELVGVSGITRFKWLPAPVYGSWLCVCGTDGAVRLYNCLSGQLVQTLQGHRETVLDLDVSIGQAQTAAGTPGAQLAVVSGAEDKTCRIFSVPLWAAGANAAAQALQMPAAAVGSASGAAPAATVGTRPGEGTPSSMEAGLLGDAATPHAPN